MASLVSAYAEYWAVPVADVPSKTGAEGLMDCADIRDVLDHLDLDLSERTVLDVGCGTGRVAQLCGDYVGCDISVPMVAYANEHGVPAFHLDGPGELGWLAPEYQRDFDFVTCLSVFTHISRADRVHYLRQFRRLARDLLVDILPGEDGGGISAWIADPQDFELDMHEQGWTEIVDSYLRVSRDGMGHLYYHCRAGDASPPRQEREPQVLIAVDERIVRQWEATPGEVINVAANERVARVGNLNVLIRRR